MSDPKEIVVTMPAPRSGEKYLTPQGYTAIKDGVRARAEPDRRGLSGKPHWLKAPMAAGAGYDAVRQTVREHRLATVCEEAKCPNIGECWNAGTATIMVLGKVCTRACRFCAVDTGNPHGWLDTEEPANVAATVALMKLKYVVLTSVDRDDLPDGGAAHYAACVRAIKARTPATAVEALTPDFQGVLRDVRAGGRIRSRSVRAEYRNRAASDASGSRSTRWLRANARGPCARQGSIGRQVLTKSSLMLGLGESDDRNCRPAWTICVPPASTC